MKQNKFTLLGYDNPLGRYPAPVVPIGQLGDKLVAVYPGDKSPSYITLERDVQYIKFDATIHKEFANFDPQLNRLFAADTDHIKAYPVNNEKIFFKKLLRQKPFSSNNPFLRLSLAKVTHDSNLIIRELTSCVLWMHASTPDIVEPWYEGQLASLKEYLPAQIYITIPLGWRDLPSVSKSIASPASINVRTGGIVTVSNAIKVASSHVALALFVLALISLGIFVYVTHQHLKELIVWIVVPASIVITHMLILGAEFYGHTIGYTWRAARRLWNFLLTFVIVEGVIGLLLFHIVSSFIVGTLNFRLVLAIIIGAIIASVPAILERSLLPKGGLTVSDLKRPLTKALLRLKLTLRHEFASAIQSCLQQDIYDYPQAGGGGLGLSRQETSQRLRMLYKLYKADISKIRRDPSLLTYDVERTPWEMGFLLVRHIGRKKLTQYLANPVVVNYPDRDLLERR